MGLNCTPVQQQYEMVIAAFNKLLPGEEGIHYHIVDHGYKFLSEHNRRTVHMTPATKRGCVVFEFSDSTESWVHNIMARWEDGNCEVIAQHLHDWFFKENGFLFNVPVNGELPAHSVTRLNGKHSRGPVKV